jgi:hypothetical protein
MGQALAAGAGTGSGQLNMPVKGKVDLSEDVIWTDSEAYPTGRAQLGVETNELGFPQPPAQFPGTQPRSQAASLD